MPLPVYPLPVYPQQPPHEVWPPVLPGTGVPVAVVVRMPPELLTLVPPVPQPAAVVLDPVEELPTVTVPVKVPPKTHLKTHLTPPRPPKQDRY